MIGIDGDQVGVLSTHEAIQLARRHGVDLVEVAPNADPPVCRVVDYGKYRYEQQKKQKEAKKHQHSNKVKEIQLRPNIDPHDFSIKQAHAIDFLCEDMKVKVSLRFRGRELAHKEYGFQTIKRFVDECGKWATPDAPPKMIGRGLTVMLSPLPKNKREANPRGKVDIEETEKAHAAHEQEHAEKDPHHDDDHSETKAEKGEGKGKSKGKQKNGEEAKFANNPFDKLDDRAQA